MSRVGLLTIIGALLPIGLGATLGMVTTESGAGTLAYPMPADVFVVFAIGLALAHLLVLAGYLGVAGRAAGAGRTFCLIGAVGTALVAACEVWSGGLASADRDSGMVTALDTGYGISSVLIAVGTVGAGIALRPTLARLAWPLLVNGLFFLLIAMPATFFGGDGLRVATLTIWSATYVWLGVALWRSTPDRTAITSPA